MGLPPTVVVEAARRVLEDWAAGTLSWGPAVDELDAARQAFARLVEVSPHRIGIGYTVAATMSAIAANLADGAVVLAPEGEHNSSLYPFLHQAWRGVRIGRRQHAAQEDQLRTGRHRYGRGQRRGRAWRRRADDLSRGRGAAQAREAEGKQTRAREVGVSHALGSYR